MVEIILIFFLLGVGAGILSGLLGVSGGLIVVPGLVYCYKILQIPESIMMHMAIGTSLAIMIVTSSRSLYGHWRRRIPVWEIYRQLFPGIVVGVLAGSLLAHFLHSRFLTILFSIFVLTLAFYTLFSKQKVVSQSLPRPFWVFFVSAVVGLQSGLLGVGGAALTIPFLLYCNVSIRQAVVVSVAVGLTVAIIGTFTYIFNGMYSSHLPSWTTGYIYWPAAIPVMLGSLLFTPLGVKWSHALPPTILKYFFVTFLFIVGIQMFLTSINFH